MHRISGRVFCLVAAATLISSCGAATEDASGDGSGGGNGTQASGGAAQAPSDGGHGKTVVVGVSGSLVPYLFQSESNQWVGANEDLLSYVFKEKGGYTIEYREMSFENLIPSLSSGRVDVTTNVYDTESRRAKLDFLDFYSSPFAVFTLAKNAEGINSWSDLCGKTLASIYASTISDAIDAANKKFCGDNPVQNQQQSGSYADLARQVDNGRVFGAIDDAGIWGYFVKRNSNYALALDSVGQTWHWALAFPKGSSLRDEVRPYLEEYLKSDLPSKSAKEWGLNPGGFPSPSE